MKMLKTAPEAGCVFKVLEGKVVCDIHGATHIRDHCISCPNDSDFGSNYLRFPSGSLIIDEEQ